MPVIAIVAAGVTVGVVVAAMPSNPGPVRVLCVGDSITSGVGVAPAYPWYLEQLLCDGSTVRNAGIFGIGSGDVRTILDAELAAASWDYVVLCAGTNDVYTDELWRTAEHLRAMVDTARAHGADVIVFTAACTGPPHYQAAMRANRYLRDLPCLVVEWASAMIPGDLIDDIHLSDQGARHLADLVAAEVRAATR